jgi:hypothetical protein
MPLIERPKFCEGSSFVLVSLTAGSLQVNAYLASLGVVDDLLRAVSAYNLKTTYRKCALESVQTSSQYSYLTGTLG